MMSRVDTVGGVHNSREINIEHLVKSKVPIKVDDKYGSEGKFMPANYFS